MADPQTQQLLQALGQLGAVALNGRAGISALNQSMARLRQEMQRGTGTVQSNAAALQSLQAGFSNLDTVTRQSAQGVSMLKEAQTMAAKVTADAAGQLSAGLIKGGLTEAVDYVTKQLYTAISSYQEGASGIQTAFNMQGAAMESQVRILDRLSTGATTAAETLALIPNWYARGAAALSGLVAGASGFAKDVYERGAKGQKMLEKEVLMSALAFDTQTKGGVLLADGIGRMRTAAGTAQLRLEEYTKVIIDNRKELQSFGGTMTAGVARFNKVNKAFNSLEAGGRDLRKELILAGYSAQEQADGVVDFMDMMNKAGRLRFMSDKEIAIQSTDYLKNLRAISAFTGEDAKQAEARAKSASEQLAVQRALRKSQDPEAFEKFKTMVKLMPADMTKGIQQMTASGGVIVDKNLNQLLAASPTRKKLLDLTYQDMTTKGMTTAQVQENYERRVKEFADALEQESDAMADSYGMVNVMTGAYGDVTKMGEEQAELARKGQQLKNEENQVLGSVNEQMKNLAKSIDPLSKSFDPLTKSIVDAERAMRQGIPQIMSTMSTGVTTYLQTIGRGKGPAGLVEDQRKEMGYALGEAIKLAAKTSPIEPGGKVSGAMTYVAEKLVSIINTLTDSVANLKRFSETLGRRHSGTLGMTGSLFEKEDALVKIAKGETVLTPKQLQNILSGSLPNAAQIFGDMAEAKKTNAAPEEMTKIIDTVTASMTGMTNQLSAQNQLTDSKLDELIQAMRDKTIFEDMLEQFKETADNTRRMANELS